MRARGSTPWTGGLVIGAVALGALLPAGASAAVARPSVTTQAASHVAQQSARLHGSVNPNERETTYFFEYGTTSAYGAQTPAVGIGNGARSVDVQADVTGLAPATRYHFRLVARNVRGTTRGRDRTLRTDRQPLGLSLAATPNPIAPGASTTLAGQLAGTGNADRRIVLQANPFPFTQGFADVGDPHLTSAVGAFAFPILSVPVTTQYRVILPGAPSVPSPVVTVGVAVQVSLSVRVRRTARRAVVRLSGTIRPAHDGSLVAIQRLRRGAWVTIDGTIARGGRRSFSRYSESVSVGRSATLRVLANVTDGDHVAGVSRSVRIRRR